MDEQIDPGQNKEPAKEPELADYFDGMKKLEMEGYQHGIKKARTALYVTAVLIFIGELLSVSTSGTEITAVVIGIALIEAGIFIGLAVWTRTKPYTAIIMGLIIFILIWVFAIVAIGGRAIYGGIIFRAIVLYYLIKALKPAKDWEDMKKTF